MQEVRIDMVLRGNFKQEAAFLHYSDVFYIEKSKLCREDSDGGRMEILLKSLYQIKEYLQGTTKRFLSFKKNREDKHGEEFHAIFIGSVGLHRFSS